MKITIVTPSFNQVQFLEQTIDSVLSQGYPDLEYIIMDGGSTDGSVELIKKHEKYLEHWESGPDGGQSAAINKGLRLATGDVFNWLNSDDYYEGNALKVIAEIFKSTEAQVVCARSRLVDTKGQLIKESNGTDIYKDDLPRTIGMARIDQPETFFQTGLLRSLGGLREQFHFVMDKDLWIRYLLQYGLNRVVEDPSTLVNFRVHSASKTSNHQVLFDRETNTIFYSMAAALGLTDRIELIRSLGILPKMKVEYHASDLAKKAINYYLLYKSDRAYYLKNYGLSKQLLKFVLPEDLSDDGRKTYRKLLVRSFIRSFLHI